MNIKPPPYTRIPPNLQSINSLGGTQYNPMKPNFNQFTSPPNSQRMIISPNSNSSHNQNGYNSQQMIPLNNNNSTYNNNPNLNSMNNNPNNKSALLPLSS
jgi:hypothetical protein